MTSWSAGWQRASASLGRPAALVAPLGLAARRRDDAGALRRRRRPHRRPAAAAHQLGPARRQDARVDRRGDRRCHGGAAPPRRRRHRAQHAGASTLVDSVVGALAQRAGSPGLFDLVMLASPPKRGDTPERTTDASESSVPPPLRAVVQSDQRQSWTYTEIQLPRRHDRARPRRRGAHERPRRRAVRALLPVPAHAGAGHPRPRPAHGAARRRRSSCSCSPASPTS